MNHQTSGTDNPLAASLRASAQAGVKSLRKRLAGTGTLMTPAMCVQAILAYALFLQRLDRLFGIIKEAAGSTTAVLNIETVRQIELGYTSGGKSHAELFAEAAAPFYEDQIHISEEPERIPVDAEGMREHALKSFERATSQDVLSPEYWRNIELLLKSASHKPEIALVAYYFVYYWYTQEGKERLADQFRQLGYEPEFMRYFAANDPKDLDRCLDLLMEAFLSETEHPGSRFNPVSIQRVITLTEKFIANIFVNAPTAAYSAVATQALAHSAAA